MAATLTEERFAGPDWVFERKFDGIRLLAYKRGADVRLYSRNRLLQELPAVASAVAALPADEVILDGEVTWDGRSGYHVFDILWLDGRLVTARSLEERRALLEALPFAPPLERVALLDDPAPWERAAHEGWEGVIAKRRGSPYEHRRSKHWLKMKCEASQELVVGRLHRSAGQTRRPGRPARRLLRGRRFRLRWKNRHRLRYEAPARSAAPPRRHRGAADAVHEGHRPAPPARALGTSGDRRAGGVHRMDGARQAAPPAPDRRPFRQRPAGGCTNVQIPNS